jgi:hypothetical protein
VTLEGRVVVGLTECATCTLEGAESSQDLVCLFDTGRATGQWFGDGHGEDRLTVELEVAGLMLRVQLAVEPAAQAPEGVQIVLGRDALEGALVVDVSHRFLHGRTRI